MKKNQVIELALTLPDDIVFLSDVTGLNDDQLIRYHDVMHQFWYRIEQGIAGLGWTFNQVIFMHTLVIKEMRRRGIKHYEPINNLDEMYYESDSSIEEMSKKMEFSLEPPQIVERN